MIGTGRFGAADSLILKKRCDEWPQVRPAIKEVLAELRRLRALTAGNHQPLMRAYRCDWVEDFSHENGNYINRCAVCQSAFYGHKRRVVCKACEWDAMVRELERPGTGLIKGVTQ
jgi:hypothetical protein